MSAASVHDETPPQPKTDTPVAADSGGGIIGFLIFAVLAVAAVWYGWKYGNQYAPWFWTRVQTYGLALGRMFGTAKSGSEGL